jgi:hypothetical protein
MAIGLGAVGGFAQGFAQGMKIQTEREDAEARRKMEERRMALLEDQAGREGKRWEYEEDKLKSERASRSRVDEAVKQLDDIEAAMSSGSILEFGQKPRAAIQSAAPQQMEAAPGVPNAAGVTSFPVASTPSAAAPQQTAQKNPFLTGAESYKDRDAALNRYYELKSSALTSLYRAKGDYEKAEAVPELMRQLRDSRWSEKVGASMSAMVANAPGAREAFASTYRLVNDGYELDPNSGKYNPETLTWTGLKRINIETGKPEIFDLTPEGAMTLANKYKKPDEVVKFLLERGDKKFTQGQEARRTAATETQAAAAQTSAQAAALKAKTDAEDAPSARRLRDSQSNYYDARAEQDKAAGQQQMVANTISRMFPMYGKPFDAIKVELGATSKEEVAEARAQWEADQRGHTAATVLAGNNPKVPATVIAGLVRHMSLGNQMPTQKDENGKYIVYGKYKIYSATN